MNKTERGYYDQYQQSIKYHSLRTIWQAYERPSIRKERIWECIEDECKKVNGYDCTVVSKNCNFFSAGFDYYCTNEDTGEITDIRHRHYLPSRTLDYSVLEIWK